MLTGILWNASTSHDENDIIDIEMQCDMLLIVSCLCEGDLHRKVYQLFYFYYYCRKEVLHIFARS